MGREPGGAARRGGVARGTTESLARSTSAHGRGTVQGPGRSDRTRCRDGGSVGRAREPRRSRASRSSGARARARRRHRESAGWHTATSCATCLCVRGDHAVGDRAQESRGGHFREDYPEKAAEFGTINIMVKQGSGGSMQVSRIPIPPLPDHLKAVIEEQKA